MENKETGPIPIGPEQTVREVLELYPQTQRVFGRHGLDLCCGGVHPISVAAAAKGVALEPLLAELNAAAQGRK